MRRWVIFLVGLLALAIGVCWWLTGIQHWLAIHTGTDNEPGPYYGFYSGFGSILIPPFITVGGIGLLAWWHHTCHEPGCFRWARSIVDDKGTRSCWRHNPQGKPTKGHIQRAHESYRARMHLYLGEGPGRG